MREQQPKPGYLASIRTYIRSYRRGAPERIARLTTEKDMAITELSSPRVQRLFERRFEAQTAARHNLEERSITDDSRYVDLKELAIQSRLYDN